MIGWWRVRFAHLAAICGLWSEIWEIYPNVFLGDLHLIFLMPAERKNGTIATNDGEGDGYMYHREAVDLVSRRSFMIVALVIPSCMHLNPHR